MTPPRLTLCSFCGKSSTETGPHVEGPSDVYLCEPCTHAALRIFRELRQKQLAQLEDRVRALETDRSGR